MVFKDYYSKLCVSPGSDIKKIKEAYRKKASASHPDKHPGAEPDETDFIEIKEAYDVLGDTERKRKYDIEYEHRRLAPVHDMDNYSGPTPINTPEDPFKRLFDDLSGRLTGRSFPGYKRHGRYDEGPGYIHYDDLLGNDR